MRIRKHELMMLGGAIGMLLLMIALFVISSLAGLIGIGIWACSWVAWHGMEEDQKNNPPYTRWVVIPNSNLDQHQLDQLIQLKRLTEISEEVWRRGKSG